MANFNLNFTPIFLLFFFLFVFQTSVQQDDTCKNVDCGRGSCVASNNSITGFECDCFLGWNRTFPVPFSPCAIPGCTLDFQCGNGTPPPFTVPSFNFSDPCSLVWCGDGACIANGTSHYCQCFDGSANLLNMTGLACVKQCSIGADCSGLGLGLGLGQNHSSLPPPPPLSNGMLEPPPPTLSNGMLPPPPPKGSNGVSKWSKDYVGLNFILLFAVILASV